MELVNLHSHTEYVTHGEGSVDQLVEAAIDAGLTTLGITEHNWLSDEVDPTHWVGIQRDRVDQYLADIRRMRDQHPEITVLAGMEMDYLGDREDRVLTEQDLAPFDYLLGSVHYVDGLPLYDSALIDQWQGQDVVDEIWRGYFQLWCDAAASDMPYTVMSHPDMAKKHALYPSFDMAPFYQDMVDAALAGERMIEVNTSGLHYVCNQLFPAPELLSMFAKAGVPCTVGTDAHEPGHVARNIPDAYRYMYEAGYREVTVPLPGGDRRTVSLEG